MAFETGTATDVYDLLDKLRAFAVAQGWTVNRFANGDELLLQNGGSYWNLKATDDVDATSTTINDFNSRHPGIVMRGSTGFDSGQDWDSQPGDSAGDTAIGVFNDTDVKAYWFFADAAATYIHVAARLTTQRYGHLHMGDMVKLGSWTGGQYVAGTVCDTDSNPGDVVSFSQPDGTHYRADIDGATDAWQTVSGNPGSNLPARESFDYRIDNNSPGGHLLDALLNAAPDSWSGRSPIWNPIAFLRRPSNLFAIAGYIPDMGVLNIKLLQPEQTLVIGGDEWIVFPIIHKSAPGDPGSGYGGFAYRKIP